MSVLKKSGYELRTELLGMAMGILGEQAGRACENEHLKPENQRKPVPFYTTEDVIVEAEKLYAFVGRKN